jgi:transcription elongation factor Elf1
VAKKKTENEASDKPLNEKNAKYRYFCPACTGRAFYSNKKEKFSSVVCQNCGTQIRYDAGNYIEI